MPDRQKTCFVLMPFAEGYQEVYDQVYTPVCSANGLRCWRVDEIAGPGSITQDIVEGIIDADIILADLTSQNPNVFYELGIAHAVGNKTIMTCQSVDEVPFDIANYRVILYEQTISGSKQLAKRLSAAIKELLAALDRTNNPVQSVIGNRSALHFKRKVPMFMVTRNVELTSNLRKLINAEGVIYLDDWAALDLEKIICRPGFGKGSKSLAQIIYIIQQFGLYGDAGALQSFLSRQDVRLSRQGGRHWDAFTRAVDEARRSI